MSDLTAEDAGMHHANMVRNVIIGLHEDLQKEKVQTEPPTAVEAPVNHVANAVQNTQQQLATQLQKIKAMMQAMHMQYAATPQGSCQDFGGRGYHSHQSNYCGR